MFKKVLEYAGEYRRTTYASIAVMLLGVVMSVLPYFFIYRLIAPPLTGELANPGQSLLWAAAIALCSLSTIMHLASDWPSAMKSASFSTRVVCGVMG